MKLCWLIGVLLLVLCQSEGVNSRKKGSKCRAAVHGIPKPSNGKVLTCCHNKKIKFVCDAGYKLTGGDEILTCKKGRIYGKFPKCIFVHKKSCGLAGYNPFAARVVGGSGARPGDWPWMAAIYRDDEFLCGGALISPSYVLTAAHCFYIGFMKDDTASRYKIWLGKTRLHKPETRKKQFSMAEEINIHPEFSLSSFRNDIGIIKLKTPMKFTKYVQPLCLPEKDEATDKRTAYIAGWGEMLKRRANSGRMGKLSKVLQHTWLPIMPDADCLKAAPRDAVYDNATMLCAGKGKGKRDACSGDSGGPLVVYQKVKNAKSVEFYQWTTVGIVSWGEGCALKKQYGYYTRLFPFLAWIKGIVGLI